MRTLVITAGETPLPAELDEVIRRGSTAVDRQQVSDLSGETPDADRVVFWSPSGDERIRQVAARFARAEARARREAIVFITSAPGDAVAGLSPAELFVWPQDKDRLTMAFMTGA